jgi:hypothetical protein
MISLIAVAALFPTNQADEEDECFTNCESLPV